MGNISFVILNYKTYEESIACAESILRSQTWEELHIVIVDNGSGNGSLEALESYFKEEKKVAVIGAEENLGFARGNNLGIMYAIRCYHPDFIVAANSDIIFEQPDYCEQIMAIFRERPFAVLGGDITDASRTQHFNPVATDRVYTTAYMRKQVMVSAVKAWTFRLLKLFHLKRLVAGHYGITQDAGGADVKDGSKNLTTREVGGVSVAADSRIAQEMEGVLLHGCCLVFSRLYFSRYDGFWPETFLYAEEEIVYYLAQRAGLTTLYSPRISCVHKEAATTGTLYRDFCDAKIFYFSQITKSYREFLGLMERLGER